jgi:hypothetical protein
MKFLTLLFAFIGISLAIFSQTTHKKKDIHEHRMNVRRAANYYLRKKLNPSPEFSVQYNSLFLGLQGYRKKDTLLAVEVINRLYQSNDILFYRLMRIRLEWEFKQRFAKSPLDSVQPLLKNNIDSAKYHYMLALYFQDSMTWKLARQTGYVRATREGNEVVDWGKVKRLKWPEAAEYISIDPLFLRPDDKTFSYFKVGRSGDSAIFYYKKAVDNDPTEFHYLKEFLVFMSNLPENKDAEMQQVINSKLNNYTGKEKKWVKKYFDSF